MVRAVMTNVVLMGVRLSWLLVSFVLISVRTWGVCMITMPALCLLEEQGLI